VECFIIDRIRARGAISPQIEATAAMIRNVKQVYAVVQDGRGANLSEANDDERGAGRVLDPAGAFLQAGDDRVGEILVVQGCHAGLP
jgi:hypothetical protein